MIAQGHGGKIVGATSLAGKQGHPALSSYSASKFAIRGLTQAVASELAPFGINVNAYAPSIIDTNMKLQLGEAYGDAEEYNKLALTRVPMGRFGRSEEVANLVSFLVSKDSEYITGQSISLNGGAFYD
ncbi:hypothetical protein ONZ45_g18431 [Pleurotus djamor]|nr:hypothetical protein ONZ45_g18431 [Pleurotus djamor]